METDEIIALKNRIEEFKVQEEESRKRKEEELRQQALKAEELRKDAEEKEKARIASLAPDKEKLAMLATAIFPPLPELQSKGGNDILEAAVMQLNGVKNYILTRIENLK